MTSGDLSPSFLVAYTQMIYFINLRPDTLSSSIDLLADEQVKALIDTAVSRNDMVGIINDPSITWVPATAWKIAPDAVAKKYNPNEPYVMRMKPKEIDIERHTEGSVMELQEAT